jgi:hypothetical protein
MVDPVEFQKLRSPSDLRAFVEQEREKVCADPEDFRRALLKQGLHKEFLDELVSISWFAILAYPDTVKVMPVLGNQAYDAVVYDELGNEIDRIEMTHPHDGADSAEDARLLIQRHFGKVHGGVPGQDFEELTKFVLDTCNKKAKKDYAECSLVISIEPMKPFSAFVNQYEAQVDSLLGKISCIHFNAKRVFLLILPDRLEEVHFA